MTHYLGPKTDSEDIATIEDVSNLTSDSWHVIGAGGEPAFAYGASSGSPYAPVSFKKLNSVVYLRGSVGSLFSGAGLLFTLPSGYRPTVASLFNIAAYTNNGRVDVYTNGQVYYQAGYFVAVLDGMSFVAA